jgi:hypothetical protein
MLVIGNVNNRQVRKAKKAAFHDNLHIISATSLDLLPLDDELRRFGEVKFVVMDEATSFDWPGKSEAAARIAQSGPVLLIAHGNGEVRRLS